METEEKKDVQKKAPAKVRKPVEYKVESIIRNRPLVLNTEGFTRGIHLPTLGSFDIVAEQEIGTEIRNAEKHGRIRITKHQ